MRGFHTFCLQQFNSDGRLCALVVCVLLGNLFFIALHAAHVAAGTSFDPGHLLISAGFHAPRFSLDADQSYAEWLGYLMLAIIVVTFIRLSQRFRDPVYFALIFIFTFTLADDSLRIHETLGAKLANLLALPSAFGLRGAEFGELLAWGLFAVPLLGFLAFALWRSHGRHRTVGLVITGWFFLLAFFGAGVDMVHSMIRHKGLVGEIAGFIEDGGEMMVVAVILALSLSTASYLGERRVTEDRREHGRPDSGRRMEEVAGMGPTG